MYFVFFSLLSGVIKPEIPEIDADKLLHDWITWYMEHMYEITGQEKDTIQYDIGKMILEQHIMNVVGYK